MLSQYYDRQKKLTQNEDLLGQRYFQQNMPLLTPYHSLKTCGGPEALASTAFFKNGGVKTSSEGLERYILKTHLKLPYPHIIHYNLIYFHLCNVVLCEIKMQSLANFVYTPAHLPWVHLPYCEHKTELAFNNNGYF